MGPTGPLSDEEDFQTKDEDEVSIPRASLNKFIKDVVPDARLTTETRELLLSCCHTFIQKLATEANIACAKANKKTISPQHILEGLDSMNLSSYKIHVQLACDEAKEEIKGRRMMSASYRFKHQDSEELERLMKEQQEIFLQARADFVGEQLDRADLLAASTAAAACAVNSQLSIVNSIQNSDLSNNNTVESHVSNDINLSNSYQSNSNLPTTTGSGQILNSLSIDDDDNYDE